MIITLDKTYYARVDSPLLGYMGETESRTITVQVYQTEGADRYILRFSYADGAQYDVNITSGTYSVQASLLRAVGNVKCQILAVKSTGADTYEYVKKSNVFVVTIKPSVGGDTPVPTYEETVAVLDKVLTAEIAADECIAAAETATGAADTASSAANAAKKSADKAAASEAATAKTAEDAISEINAALITTTTNLAQAEAARTAAETAATEAEDNKTTAVNAAQTAAQAADTANSAADVAVTAKNTATTAANTATAKATAAESSATAAQTAQTAAETAEIAAEAAQGVVESKAAELLQAAQESTIRAVVSGLARTLVSVICIASVGVRGRSGFPLPPIE